MGWQGAWPLTDGACANARLAGGGRTVLGPYLYAGPSNGTGILSQVRLHTLHAAGGDFRRSTPPWLSTRSEEHTSELQSLMRISYAVFCLKKKTTIKATHCQHYTGDLTRQ